MARAGVLVIAAGADADGAAAIVASLAKRDAAQSEYQALLATTAVRLGRSPSKLSRAFPTRDPRRSPRVESTPPSTRRARSRNQPVTENEGSEFGWKLHLHLHGQLNRLARAIGSRTVIFLRSISTRLDALRSPKRRVIVTRVDPIASAMA